MNCIANDSKCTKFREICLLSEPVYNQGFLQSGILTIRGSYNQGSYNQGFLQSGVCISVSYMTHLCTVIDIDRCFLHSGVQMNVPYMTGLLGSYTQGSYD